MHSLSHITPSAGTFAGTSAPAHYMAAREKTDVCQAAGKGFSSQATAELPWASGGKKTRASCEGVEVLFVLLIHALAGLTNRLVRLCVLSKN